jgi:phosphopantetheine--protein transferase-like protein
VYPADLVVWNDPDGRPRLHSLLEPARADLPTISIAHTEGVAVALAALDTEAQVGIDIEPIGTRTSDFEVLSFKESERANLDRIAAAGGDRAEWLARFWCAKEAVAKALGHGLPSQPLRRVVVAADTETGEVHVALSDRAVRAVTDRRGHRVWAWSLAEEVNL